MIATKKEQDTLTKLEFIAEHYKKQYNLTTFIDICRKGNKCCHSSITDYIFIALEYLIDKCNKDTCSYWERFNIAKGDYNNLFIIVLLHEIKHTIDSKSGLLAVDRANLDIVRYKEDNEYQRSRLFEIRADDFARVELNRYWKGFLD